jgi:integrase
MANPVQLHGIWYFRKRIPKDVLALIGGQPIVKRSLGKGTDAEIKARFLAVALEYERIFQNLRVGIRSLTPEQCHAIAGEIYAELIAGGQGKGNFGFGWAALLYGGREAKENDFVDMGRSRDPMPKLEWLDRTHGERIRKHLSERGILVDDRTYLKLLHAVNDASIQASEVIERNARGDYSEDPRAVRFPDPKKCGVSASDDTKFEKLYDVYCKARKLDEYRAKKYRHFFDSMIAHCGTDDMAQVTEDHLLKWRDMLEASGLSQKTIKEGYFAHVKALFRWARRKKHLPVDPSFDVYVENNDDAEKMRGLTDAEARTILAAALAPFSHLTKAEMAAARRWVPWICAYTGARVNEITQLRACDVIEEDGIWCLDISPEAGTVKNKASRRKVPIHQHLIDQGFLKFAHTKTGAAPFFYSLGRTTAKYPAQSVGNKLAEWVRGLGITDKTVAPNHGWRHRFKTLGRRYCLDDKKLDAIQGHAPNTAGGKYGVFEPAVLLVQIAKIPNFVVEAAETVDRRRRPNAGQADGAGIAK